MQQQPIYPTKWQLGKPRGTANERENDYRAVVSPPGQKQMNKIFTFSKYGGKANAKKEADKWCQELSDKLGLTRNQIRYIDANTIEVQLTQDKIMKTNAKYLNQVQLYPLNVKTKKSKSNSSKDRHYVMCQNIKKVFPFTDLICNYKIVEYINNDSLDLREENLKEFGSVEIKDIKVGKEIVNITQNDVNIQYECFDKDIIDLPKNIWILGKPAGTVFKRSDTNVYTATVHDENNKAHTKTFNIDKFKSDEETKKAAEKWQFETSYKLGMTKNLIKIINDDTIEIKLTKNELTKTNKIFIQLIQKIPLFSCKSGNGIIYCMTSINNQNVRFHGLITGFDMVDHIDGNTLNNTLINLRYCDISMNNSNRHEPANNKHGYTGLRLDDRIYGQCYVAKVTIHGKQFSRYFSISTYGENKAKEMAIAFKKKTENVTKYVVNIDEDDDEKLLRIDLLKLGYSMSYIKTYTVYDIKEYLSGVELNEGDRLNMHLYYMDEQMKYYRWCKKEHDRLSRILIKKLTSKKPGAINGKKESEMEKEMDNYKQVTNQELNLQMINKTNKENKQNQSEQNDSEMMTKRDININLDNQAISNQKSKESKWDKYNKKYNIIVIDDENQPQPDDIDKIETVDDIVGMIKEKKDNIATGVKKFNATEKGKKLKQESHKKRSETMAKQKEEFRANLTEKQCGTCKETKQISEFGSKKDAKDGHQPNCKICVLQIKQEWRKKQREAGVKNIT
jgi:hypothetical protein